MVFKGRNWGRWSDNKRRRVSGGTHLLQSVFYPWFHLDLGIKLQIKWAAHKLQSSSKRTRFSASVMCVLKMKRRTLGSNSHFLQCVEGSGFTDGIETILPSLRFPIFFSRYISVPRLSLSLHRSRFTRWLRSQFKAVDSTVPCEAPLWFCCYPMFPSEQDWWIRKLTIKIISFYWFLHFLLMSGTLALMFLDQEKPDRGRTYRHPTKGFKLRTQFPIGVHWFLQNCLV